MDRRLSDPSILDCLPGSRDDWKVLTLGDLIVARANDDSAAYVHVDGEWDWDISGKVARALWDAVSDGDDDLPTTLCVECGPQVPVDEDGCCCTCGATARGTWLNGQCYGDGGLTAAYMAGMLHDTKQTLAEHDRQVRRQFAEEIIGDQFIVDEMKRKFHYLGLPGTVKGRMRSLANKPTKEDNDAD